VIAPDKVRTSTTVAVDPDTAFRVFTEEIDLWWKRGPAHRFGPGRNGTLRFEPGTGGRLLEVFDDAQGGHYEVGKVLAWEPGARLVFEFRALAFEPGQITEVEIRFARAPGGTRVELEHRGWGALRADHPARHGLQGEAFASMIGLWWADLLLALGRRARSRAA
jgi:uncharacterized protein YndB with AHSA1/START domain